MVYIKCLYQYTDIFNFLVHGNRKVDAIYKYSYICRSLYLHNINCDNEAGKMTKTNEKILKYLCITIQIKKAL